MPPATTAVGRPTPAGTDATRTVQQPMAVVTGAAGGIGASFARQLYRQGYQLLLVDLSESRLQAIHRRLQQEAESAAGDRPLPEIQTHVADLTDQVSIELLAERLTDTPGIELLVNNAGFGSLNEFTEVDIERHAEMIAIHVEAPTRLVHAVLPQMKARRRGGIINLASLGAFAPCAQSVMYAATKSYLVVFSEALQEDLRGTGICVQALCPGFVRTDFHANEAMRNFHRRKVPAALWTTADAVAACALKRLGKGQVITIPGWRSRMLGLLMQMILLKPLVRIATRPRH